MSSKSWYILWSKAVPARYGLSKNIQTLLQHLDLYYSGGLEADELGRLVRLSPHRRTAIANTIAKCANIIKKDPSELRTCVDVIEMCTEILEIADKRPPLAGFPFMKLPMEIRTNILHLIVANVFTTTVIVPASKKSRCSCPSIDPPACTFQSAHMKALPTLFGAALNQEFCRFFFRRYSFRFTCPCELLAHLEQNEALFQNIHHLSVHWCGLDAAKAFTMLAKCPRLETLKITISKFTPDCMSENTQIMRAYFPASFRHPRFTDTLGLDELLTIRGLKDVKVWHGRTKGSWSMRVESERAGLSRLLSNHLTKPRSA
ncbi:hypothetical protein DCS_05311 [Drechmeria coniospora]|uniref:Uncharacterized protein n=1 Tax=Drechmeria coniospora TaxID=98403 RepID=A0A151GMJ8_DRECN|nr:hypothetical protein DCS_05311 [Drechmeria coniospora]KYK58298.1 hypothetical protein DCS_05311 [Drechmeria coniospora]ODA82865.1 hypothetical protein RJ55_01374 [Drechmeria coniospora]